MAGKSLKYFDLCGVCIVLKEMYLFPSVDQKATKNEKWFKHFIAVYLL